MVTVYVNGSSAGTPPGKNDHLRAKRDVVKGWSAGAVRRHTRWLQSMDADALSEGSVGWAITLTMRDCPPTADDLHSMRVAWIKRVTRAGAERIHWVIEWQRRGVPHIHVAAYWPEDHPNAQDGADLAIFAWTSVAERYTANLAAQYYDGIDGALGWLKYLSKHAARGARHYQRSGHPEGWSRTGRLWGHTGDWPVLPPLKFAIDRQAGFRYRRLVRSWRVSDARKDLDRARQRQDPTLVDLALSRLVFARRMLRCNDRNLSEVRGVSDWIPEAVNVDLLLMLRDQGYDVEQVSE